MMTVAVWMRLYREIEEREGRRQKREETLTIAA
jgi:hypothetical protein